MAASFASRLSGLREKKISAPESEEGQLRLTLPPDQSQKSSYEPSATFSNTRTSFRLLKGRIERKESTEKVQIPSSHPLQQSKPLSSTQKLTLLDQPKSNLKLVLNDQPDFEEKKPINEPPKIPLQKRILIAKEQPKEEPKRQELPPPPPKREQPPLPPKMEKQASKQLIRPEEERPIREQEAEESLPPESENDLVMCPEGCGRSFNRKALEKHAKACKLVFMSKRKEFNSEAKRVTKEQVAITKQTKIEDKKKMGMTKGKGFGATKTGQNWKAASEDFRSAIKAMKKEEKDEKEEKDQREGEGEEEVNIDAQLQQKKVVTVQCQYCQKQFNEVFIEKHMQNCYKKKEKQRSRDQKKKTTKK